MSVCCDCPYASVVSHRTSTFVVCLCLFAEFIVYDIAQIRMRYLIKMGFNYKK